ncbi:MAG: sigma-70 family RNA polymerase sigma factor [Acidobacteria bacterium]|nr:sigma-70 family RNA polymerase sigma factor [Acidobacteriota bacterium]MBI3426842.1 sigma-70 family RNA polymerase sigma factor [Acidobacteriota bacterium]
MQLSTPQPARAGAALTGAARRANAKTETAALQKQLGQWMAASAAGDQAAFTKLYDATQRQVYGLLLRMLKNPATAEEVLLDVYLQVWRQAASYDTARGSVWGWLMTITRSRALDRWRASAGQLRESDDLETVSLTVAAVTDSPEANSLLNERSKLVRQALTQLTPEQRLLIETAYFEGLSHSELAERFALPLGTVKTRIRTGMVSLRKCLERYGSFDC